MKNKHIAKLSRIVKLLATGNQVDHFGLCPTCLNKEISFLIIGSDVYFVCHEHKFYWLEEEKFFSKSLIRGGFIVPGSTEPDLQQNRELIASYTAVEPWRRPRWAWQLDTLTRRVRHLTERTIGCFTLKNIAGANDLMTPTQPNQHYHP